MSHSNFPRVVTVFINDPPELGPKTRDPFDWVLFVDVTEGDDTNNSGFLPTRPLKTQTKALEVIERKELKNVLLVVKRKTKEVKK